MALPNSSVQFAAAPYYAAPALAPSRQEMVAAARTVQRLQKTANCRKVAVKVSACCCLPIALAGFCVAMTTNCCSLRAAPYSDLDLNGVVYSPFTRCDAGNCWRPKLWPENASDLWCDSVCCDSCICCICCTHETHNDFLYYPERVEMNAAIRILSVPLPDPAEGEQDVPGIEILDGLAIPPLALDRQPRQPIQDI